MAVSNAERFSPSVCTRDSNLARTVRRVPELFSSRRLVDALGEMFPDLLREIDNWPDDDLLGQSEQEIVAFLSEKHSVQCPDLRPDDRWADEPLDIKQRVQTPARVVEVPATRVVVHVPFDGDVAFFNCRPNSFDSMPPTAIIGDAELSIVYESRDLNSAQLTAYVDSTIASIQKWLDWARPTAAEHNEQVRSTVGEAVARRKAKLIADRKTVASLGIPIRRTGEPPTFSIPLQRRRPDIARPAAARAGYETEPTLAVDDYEHAIRVIAAAGRTLERLPATAGRLREESLRDVLLVALNSQFEGQAGGEVFNGAGKTDILLRVDDRTVFIGECKFWGGPKKFRAAIDQLFTYLVWRDTKAAILLFIRDGDASAIIEKAAEALASHERCVRADGSADSGRRDYVFVAADDERREIRVALLPFVIRT